MKNKFVMTPAQNRNFVRARLDDFLYAGMLLARYDVTKEAVCDPSLLYEGSEEKTALLNFRDAYDYILENYDREADYDQLIELHSILMRGLMDTYSNQLDEEQIRELNEMIDQPAKANTEIALDVLLHILGKRLFTDGDVRVALMFANKIMVDKGNGFIVVIPEKKKEFREKLKEFNETHDPLPFKEWLYANCLRGKMNYD